MWGGWGGLRGFLGRGGGEGKGKGKGKGEGRGREEGFLWNGEIGEGERCEGRFGGCERGCFFPL